MPLIIIVRALPVNHIGMWSVGLQWRNWGSESNIVLRSPWGVTVRPWAHVSRFWAQGTFRGTTQAQTVAASRLAERKPPRLWPGSLVHSPPSTVAMILVWLAWHLQTEHSTASRARTPRIRTTRPFPSTSSNFYNFYLLINCLSKLLDPGVEFLLDSGCV